MYLKNLSETALFFCVLAGFSAVAQAEKTLTLALLAERGDATPILRGVLAKCRWENIARLVLGAGQWELYPDQAVGMFRHISNHDPGYRRVALHLDEVIPFRRTLSLGPTEDGFRSASTPFTLGVAL